MMLAWHSARSFGKCRSTTSISPSACPAVLSHPLGTDDLGQDLLARMLYGGRISLAVGSRDAGRSRRRHHRRAIAGMSRGGIDVALMWLTDLFLSLPQLRCCCS